MRNIIQRILLISSLLGILSIFSNVYAQTPSNVLIVGQIAEPKSLDPQAVTAINDFRILMNVYEGLVRYKDGSLEIEPSLAESWTISEDGKQYTFKLKQGVKFHDGSPLNADAIVFNFERMLDEAHPYHNTGPFPLSFFFSAVKDVKAIDAKTVEFTLNAPFAPFCQTSPILQGLSYHQKPLRSTKLSLVEILQVRGRSNLLSGKPTVKSWLLKTTNIGVKKPKLRP